MRRSYNYCMLLVLLLRISVNFVFEHYTVNNILKHELAAQHKDEVVIQLVLISVFVLYRNNILKLVFSILHCLTRGPTLGVKGLAFCLFIIVKLGNENTVKVHGII